MFEKVNIPILGIVENMAVHVCSNCGHEEHIFGAGGGERMAAEYGVTLLGSLPLDLHIREQADSGNPTVVADPEAASRRSIARSPGRLPSGSPRSSRTTVPCSRRSSFRTLERVNRKGAEAQGPRKGHRTRLPLRFLSVFAPLRFSYTNERQIRQMDPPHGGAARHDRAVRAQPDQAGERPPGGVVRHLELRLRHPLLGRLQAVHRHQQHHRRPEKLRPQVLRRREGRALHHPAQLLRAGAHGRVFPHSAQCADTLSRQVARTRAAASS